MRQLVSLDRPGTRRLRPFTPSEPVSVEIYSDLKLSGYKRASLDSLPAPEAAVEAVI